MPSPMIAPRSATRGLRVRGASVPRCGSAVRFTRALVVAAIVTRSTAALAWGWSGAAVLGAASAPDATDSPAADEPTPARDDSPATSPVPDAPAPSAEEPAVEVTATTSLPPREPGLPPAMPPDGARRALPDGARRALPDYEGRPPLPPSAAEVFIWFPRALLFPPHLVLEYGVRRPVVAFVHWSERHYVWPRLYDFFTWDNGRSGVYPVFNFDLGLKQTVGLTLFSRELIDRSHSLRISASAADQGVFTAGFQDRVKVLRDGSGAVVVSGGLARRPDGVFYGIGPDTQNGDKTFYAYHAYALAFGLEGSFGGMSRALIELGYRDASFGGSRILSTPSIETRFGGVGQAPLPDGFSGYRLLEPRAVLTLDSRAPQLDTVIRGTGARAQVEAAYAVDPGDTQRRFVRWGGAVAGFYDFSGAGHVLGLEVAARFVENLGTHGVPFTELPSLGGTEWMRGFLGGRLRGPSTATAVLQYRYPIAAFADAELFSSVGNAFFGHLDGFSPGRLFLNNGAAIRTTFSRESSIALTVAFASNRFDDPSFRVVDATRVSMGVIHGF